MMPAPAEKENRRSASIAGHVMRYSIQDIIRGKTVVVGIGNTLRGDDGLGPRLAERLRARHPACCINAEGGLENHLGAIVQLAPRTIVLADATELGERPGSWRVLPGDSIQGAGLSTHDASIELAVEYLHAATEARIWLLAVQPATTALGAELSAEVMQTLESLYSGIDGILAKKQG